MRWDTDPTLIGGLLAVALVYRLLVNKMRPALEPFPSQQALWFDGSLILFYLAVGSPLDTLGEQYLFTAHMLQHCLLIFVMPIMLFRGTPAWMLAPLAENRATRALMRVVFHPILAVIGFNVVFSVWHIPGLYEWALRDQRVHELEHLMFLGAGLWMWWPIVTPLSDFRLSDGGQILYVFVLSITQIPLFAYLCFTGHVLYPTYENAPRLHELLPPIEDQILGGILMKVLGELFFITVILVALMRWYKREGGHTTPRIRKSTAPAAL